jgi:hypothetical protein
MDCRSPFDLLLLPRLQLCFRANRISQIYYAFPFGRDAVLLKPLQRYRGDSRDRNRSSIASAGG